MKKIVMFAMVGVMSLSMLWGVAGSTVADAKVKTYRCSIKKNCRVAGTHHSKNHCLRTCTAKRHSANCYLAGRSTTSSYAGTHHSEGHGGGGHH